MGWCMMHPTLDHPTLRRLHYYAITTRSRPPDILHYPQTEDKEWLVCIYINSRHPPAGSDRSSPSAFALGG